MMRSSRSSVTVRAPSRSPDLKIVDDQRVVVDADEERRAHLSIEEHALALERRDVCGLPLGSDPLVEIAARAHALDDRVALEAAVEDHDAIAVRFPERDHRGLVR